MTNALTSEDFAHANIAIRGTHDVARRVDPDSTLPWTYGGSEWEDDQGMVEHGWRPVREVAPQREPWADLADAMEAGIPWIDRWNATEAAKSLHERGARVVTDGEES